MIDSTTGTLGLLDSTIFEDVATTAPWSEEDLVWTLIVGFIVAFILAFAVGANDVANSFGTTVGANVLTLKTACILASIFETLGAVLIGAKVGETIRKGIIDVTVYNSTAEGRELLMIGNVSAMTGAAIWQLIATCLGLPVSGTHSIVGACLGFSLVAVGPTGINWKKLGFIIASWFISPVVSGILAVSLYIFLNKVILNKTNPLKNGLRCLPFFYAFTFGINLFSIFYTGAPLLGCDLPKWSIFLITLGLMVFIGIGVQCCVVPFVRRKALGVGDVEESKNKIPINHSEDVFSCATNLEKKGQSDTKLNDSGYQTPNDPNKNIKISVDQSDFAGLIYEQESNPVADDRLLQSEKEIDDDERSQNELSDFGEVKKPLNESSSYDGGDSDSACKNTSKIQSKKKKTSSSEITKIDSKNEDDDVDEDPQSVRQLFSSLQILTACFGSFAHGGNDVSNAIGPLIALWLIYHSGNVVQAAATPWYLLLYGGAGIVAGLWILGRRVIKTIGSDLTKITPSRGFCIELMTAFTVLIASNIGIPVSTTHCKVGSVVSIGWFRSRSSVTWATVRNIALAWFVTVPVSGLISAAVMWFLMTVTQ